MFQVCHEPIRDVEVTQEFQTETLFCPHIYGVKLDLTLYMALTDPHILLKGIQLPSQVIETFSCLLLLPGYDGSILAEK